MATENCVPNRARLGEWQVAVRQPWRSWAFIAEYFGETVMECVFCGGRIDAGTTSLSWWLDRCPNCHRKA
jgi:hypothetical protein